LRERSLKRKLIIRNTTTLSAVFVAFLITLVSLNWHYYSKQTREAKQDLQEEMINQGMSLVADKPIMLPDDVEFNRYQKFMDLIEKIALSQEEIVFAGFIDTDKIAWAWLEMTGQGEERTKSREVFYDSREKIDTIYTRWALSLEGQDYNMHLEGGPAGNVYVFAATIYIFRKENDYGEPLENPYDEKVGVIIFGLTTDLMTAKLARNEEEFTDNLVLTLIVLGLSGLAGLAFGIFVTQRQASTITQPLEALTEAADFIAAGNYDVSKRVREIRSDDEIQQLASSFTQMVEQVDRANRDLRDLNRHLEDKVEERTKQLKESESKFRTLFEESADAILVSSREHFLDCNQAMLDMMKVPDKEEFLRLRPEDIVPALGPNGEAGLEQFNLDFSREEGFTSRHFEWVNRRSDGAVFPTETVVTTFTLNGERVLHMVLRDITERRDTEDKLKVTQQKLVDTAHSAGMAEIATGVLHNIGNILNSVNISTEEISGTLKSSKLKGFLKANELVADNLDALSEFFTENPKGRLIPGYYISLGEAMEDEHKLMTEEIGALVDKISMMRDVISTQQSYAKATLYTENVLITDIVEDALKLQLASLSKQGVKVIRRFDHNPRGSVPKVKLVHVLTNLIKNGKEAMYENDKFNRPQRLEISVTEFGQGMVEIRVRDNGCGIRPDNLEKIFNHGFTTKKEGHGFGLHTCANFMTEMGGSLVAESEGEGQGSCFVVRFPLASKANRVLEEHLLVRN